MAAGGNLASIAAMPRFPVTTIPRFAGAVGKTIDGTFQSVLFAGPMEDFELVFENQSDAQIASLKQFYADNSGPTSGFIWTNPLTSITHNLRFDPATPLEIVKISPNTSNARVGVLYRKV